MTPEGLAFAACLFCVFVDIMGQQFLAPVLVPYAQSLDATLEETGYLLTAEFSALLISQFLMSSLADSRGRRPVLLISLSGSALAYLVQGLAPLGCGTGSLYFNGNKTEVLAYAGNTTVLVPNPDACKSGWETLLAGKILAGLFGGTFSTTLAYVAELSMPDMELLKQRQTWLFSVRTVIPIALGGVGGAIATFGLFIPFLISSLMAVCGFIFTACHLREAKDIRREQADQDAEIAGKFPTREIELVVHKDKATEEAKETGAGANDHSEDDGEQADTATDEAKNATDEAENAADEADEATEDDVGDIEESSASIENEEADTQASALLPTPKSDKPVYLDPVLLMIGAAFVFLGISMSSVLLLYPLHFEQPSFGLPGSAGSPSQGLVNDDGVSILQGEVSKTVGLMNIPLGICQVLSMNFLFLRVSKKIGKFGNIASIMIGGILLIPGTAWVGLSTKLWQVALANSYMGVCAGLFLGGLMNLPNSYITRVFPHKIARARVVYLTCMFFGQMVGPLMVSNVYSSGWKLTAWLIVGTGYAISSIICFLAGLLINHKLAPFDKDWAKRFAKLTPRQHELALKTGAELDVDVFFSKLFADIRQEVERRHNEDRLFLFSGRTQTIVREKLLNVIPDYPPWSSDSPAPHLYAIAGDLASLKRDEDVEALASHHRMPELLGLIGRAPHQASNQSPGTMMMVGGGLSNVHFSFEAEDGRSRSSSVSSSHRSDVYEDMNDTHALARD